ncbi:c-type cytochrome biogenesis protein CcmI [Pantoea sp. 1.19]|uniref:c-type cytochrome biogenesis protein CcmI n=1 Tax=Pantoea sp. 1.19 TaxID=1925589 RepID=UPI000948C501|nr:c-type cytochrome biogenesis protein CcmI [Pantoea sp. 1.19]
MMLFWLVIITILTLLCVGMIRVCRPQARAIGPQRATLNARFYQQRLRELDEEEAQGVVAQRQQMEQELQLALLQDVPVRPPAAERCVHRAVLLPGMLLLVAGSLGLYALTGGYAQVRAWQQAQADYPALRRQLLQGSDVVPDAAMLRRFSLGLRSALQQHPERLEDWRLLGRIAVVLNDGPQAKAAFRRAMALAPDNESVRLDYADIMTRAGDERDQREAGLLLRDMLNAHPDDVRLLALAALNAEALQHTGQAIALWQAMLARLPAGDTRREAVARALHAAQSTAGQSDGRLPLTVTLSTAAQNMLPAGGVLYISVTDGESAVPVAVKRLPLSHFPLSLTLDDSDAMTPERLLSAQTRVQVRARIARDGRAAPQPGDWYGETPVMPFIPAQALQVNVNQRQP